jgi:hypothetical protein
MSVTIQSAEYWADWPNSRDSTFEVRAKSNKAWVSAESEVVPANESRVVGTGTITALRPTIPNLTLPATSAGLDDQTARWTVTLHRIGIKSVVSTVLDNFPLPSSFEPTVTWAQIKINKNGKQPLRDTSVYTKTETNTQIALAVGTLADASTTLKGRTKISVAPVSASNPIAVGDNDPRNTDNRAPMADTPLLMTFSYSGDGSLAIGHPVKMVGANAVITTTSDTKGCIGIVASGIVGAVTVAIGGSQSSPFFDSVMDGTEGYYVVISPTVNGQLHAQASYPPSGQVIGRVRSVTNGDTVAVIELFGGEVRGFGDPLASVVSVALAATSGAGTLASPYIGWDTAITWSANSTYIFTSQPDGSPAYYAYSTAPNWAKKHIRLIGNGNILKFTGTGNATSFIGAATPGSGTFGVNFSDFVIIGSATATRGMYMEACHHAIVRNIQVRDVTTAAFEFHFAILSTYDNLRYSQNEDTVVVQPAKGIVTNIRNAGETVQACTFINPIIEGTSGNGIDLANTWQCQFIGGSSEGNGGAGVILASTCEGNTFIGTDCESNTGDDFSDAGYGNIFTNVLSTGATTIKNAARYAVIRGGGFNSFTTEASALGTVIDDHPSWDISGSGTVTDNSSTTDWRTSMKRYSTGALSGPKWNAPTLLNSWVNFGAPYQTSGYRMRGAEVLLRGMIKSGTVPAVAFSLPTGFRPGSDESFIVRAGNTFGVVTVTSAGDVTVEIGSNANVSLETVRFTAEG